QVRRGADWTCWLTLLRTQEIGSLTGLVPIGFQPELCREAIEPRVRAEGLERAIEQESRLAFGQRRVAALLYGEANFGNDEAPVEEIGIGDPKCVIQTAEGCGELDRVLGIAGAFPGAREPEPLRRVDRGVVALEQSLGDDEDAGEFVGGNARRAAV